MIDAHAAEEEKIRIYKAESKQRELAIFKKNSIILASTHKLHCENEQCEISLYFLMKMAETAGVEFTKEEIGIFL